MSWLRSSPLRSSFTKQRSRDSPPKDADPVACYDSFRKHWQQSHDIICHSLPPKGIPNHDDVLGVVNHVDQMITLLLLELRDFTLRHRYQACLQKQNIVTATQLNNSCSPCLEHLLSENLLDKLYEWSIHTGRFGDAVRLEQLKLYELLISHDSTLLAHEPVTRPLLRLLDEWTGDIMPVEVHNKLVVLLNHVCVSLVQNNELLGLFFRPTATGRHRFIIFTLLIPHIHREGGVGQQARDAMLLCMSLSKKNDEIGIYIAESHLCLVLAAGLGGRYSLLPRILDIESEDWHRLTVDDINDLSALTQLMNSLEFCNAVTQVAHSLVQKKLSECLYRGFLVPVIGPALLQTSVDELVAATAYFDLFLRSVTEPGLLRSLIKFLLEENYDGKRILDHLIERISSQRSRLSMVTLALFETLVDLNCEDVMLELCLGALAPCSHVMLSQRRRLLRDLDPFGRCAEKFLSLTPECCATTLPSILIAASTVASVSSSTSPSLLRNVSSTSTGAAVSPPRQQQITGYKNMKLSSAIAAETLYSNYYAYLRDARQKIASCQLACMSWSRRYEDEEEDYEDEIDGADDTDNENGNYNDEYFEDYESSVCGSAYNNPDNGIHLEKSISTNNNKAETLTINDNFPMRKNSTDEKVNRILASFSNKPIINYDKVSNIDLPESTSKHTSEEREKLDADIAELLGETIENSTISETLEIYNATNAKSSTGNIEESNATLNSLQLSLSGGESSGYESFAFKGTSESTPINDDYDDESCSVSKASADQTFPCTTVSPKSDITNDSQKSETYQPQSSTSTGRRKSIQQKRRRFQRKNAITKNPSSKQQEIVDGQPPSVGIFLDVILKKLECMTENNVYVNLHLTGLISRLAIYPQPLLQSFLLNHSLVFQPSIRSLFQVLASLKHKIDGYLSKQQEDVINVLVEQARIFLISRENRLINARKNVLEAAAQFPSPKKNYVGGEIVCFNTAAVTPMPLTKALEPKRRSLTSSLTQMFRKTTSNLESQFMSTDSLNSSDSFPYIAEEEIKNGNAKQRNNDSSSWEQPNKVNRLQTIILCAVILDEWLKELAAITQEHTILSWFTSSTVTDNSKFSS